MAAYLNLYPSLPFPFPELVIPKSTPCSLAVQLNRAPYQRLYLMSDSVVVSSSSATTTLFAILPVIAPVDTNKPLVQAVYSCRCLRRVGPGSWVKVVEWRGRWPVLCKPPPRVYLQYVVSSLLRPSLRWFVQATLPSLITEHTSFSVLQSQPRAWRWCLDTCLRCCLGRTHKRSWITIKSCVTSALKVVLKTVVEVLLVASEPFIQTTLQHSTYCQVLWPRCTEYL